MDKLYGVVVLDNASTMKGIYSAHISNVASSYLEQRFGGTNDLYVAFYLKLSAIPTANIRIMLISNAGTTIGNLYLMTNGALRLRNGSTTIGVASTPLSLNTLYRLGIHQKLGAGNNAVLEAFLVAGDQSFGAPFAQLTNGTWTSQADRIHLGITTSPASGLDLFTDDIRLDATSMPGLYIH